MPTPDNQVPLCVDLDGTLIKTELLFESFPRLLKRNPFWLFPAIFWLLRGPAFLKREIAARVTLDPATLPYNESFLTFLREAKRSGRKLILATGSDRTAVMPVANYVGLFDEVLASNGKTNLRGASKRKALTEKFGERGFDYAGNSSEDLAVWQGAREAVVVNGSRALSDRVAQCAKLGPVFSSSTSRLQSLSRCLQPHRWVKNLIIFVPVLTGHELGNTSLLLRTVWAFGAFCLCASGAYVVNDLMDLEADRHHPTRQRRPFAAGDLPLQAGLVFGPALLVTGALVAAQLSWLLAVVVAVYSVLAMIYSWWVRQIALLDVFFVAGSYAVRLVAGYAATGIASSVWLLVFSMFVCLSMALAKRYVELDEQRDHAWKGAAGRDYMISDLRLVAYSGVGSGYVAALVPALYANSREATRLYAHPMRLLLICPLLLYWFSRVWLLARRGQLHDDPIVFALKDPVSYIVGALSLVMFWLAAGG